MNARSPSLPVTVHDRDTVEVFSLLPWYSFEFALPCWFLHVVSTVILWSKGTSKTLLFDHLRGNGSVNDKSKDLTTLEVVAMYITISGCFVTILFLFCHVMLKLAADQPPRTLILRWCVWLVLCLFIFAHFFWVCLFLMYLFIFTHNINAYNFRFYLFFGIFRVLIRVFSPEMQRKLTSIVKYLLIFVFIVCCCNTTRSHSTDPRIRQMMRNLWTTAWSNSCLPWQLTFVFCKERLQVA